MSDYNFDVDILETIEREVSKNGEKELSGIIISKDGKQCFIMLTPQINDSLTAYFSSNEYLCALDDDCLLALVHSHVKEDDFSFSNSDIEQAEYCHVPWLLFKKGKTNCCLYYSGAYSDISFNRIPKGKVYEVTF